MIWKKVTSGNTLEEFVKEKNSKTISEILQVNTEYKFDKFYQVAERFTLAKQKNEEVKLIGDYDSDGVNSILILVFLFLTMGIKFQIILPKRFTEGYGVSQKIVERLDPGGLLVTVDNGIKAGEAIRLAKEKGMDVIILDHHQAGNELPCADIIIDPAAIGEAEYLHYCGAGIAYRLAEFVLGKEHPIMPVLSSFAALGTIGDCVELTGDNRKIVMTGLQALKMGKTTLTMQYLMEQAKISASSTATDFAFHIVPVINAPGRLYDDGAKIAVNALFQNGQYAEQAAVELIEVNQERKRLVEKYLSEIDSKKLAESKEKSIFYYNPEIPLGIIGIIAGNLSQATGRPAFVFAKQGDTDLLKGSVRSNSDEYSIIQIIEACSHFLDHFGGHPKAAGIGLKEENLDLFKNAIDTMLPEVIYEEFIPYDLEISDDDFKVLAEKILALEPCGEGNEAPIVRIRSKLKRMSNGSTYKLLGEKKEHIKFFCNGFDALAFRQADKLQEGNHPQFIDMIGRITENNFHDKRNLQLIVTDFLFL